MIHNDEEKNVNPSDAEDTYQSIQYNGRTLIPFGTIGKTMHRSDISACLGYLVQDETKMEDVRICLLADDAQAGFLVFVTVGGIMNQPLFYRAVDTAGKEISIPPFIEDLGYDFWR